MNLLVRNRIGHKHIPYFRSDKERTNLKSELDAVNKNFEAISKQKQGLEKTCRMLDEQLGDSNSRCATMETNLRDLADKYNKLVLKSEPSPLYLSMNLACRIMIQLLLTLTF